MSQAPLQRILLVDDDAGLCGVVCDFLQSKGFLVEMHRSVEAARQVLFTQEYDLLILDWDLPGASGIDLCKEYRDKGGLSPVLMVTGHTAIDDKELGLECGADDYVTKPFSLRDLHARIKSLLRRVTAYAPKSAAAEDNAARKNPDVTVQLLDKDFVLGGKYRLEEQIGVGGMALVWKASDIAMKRTVVVKLMHEHLSNDEGNLKRFEHECRMMAKIKHPNVVTIFDSGVLEDSIPYMVMEYVQGESLRHLIDDRGPAPVKSAVAVMMQICAGLQEAHEAGVIHRDLKPDNIVIQDRSNKPDSVKIVDFGIARLIDSKERFTKTGTVIGTMEYISPEQLRDDDDIDGRADIYALGIIFFEMLTADLPLKARTLEGLVTKHLIGVPTMPSAKREDIEAGSAIDLIVGKCLEKRPSARYQSAKELSEALQPLF